MSILTDNGNRNSPENCFSVFNLPNRLKSSIPCIQYLISAETSGKVEKKKAKSLSK